MDLFLKFFSWLNPLMHLWVRSKVFPKHPINDLGIDSKKPICFVLKTHSIRDLLVLDYYCKKYKLPRPIHRPRKLKNNSSKASVIYLAASGLIQAHRSKKTPTQLLKLIEFASQEKSDIQILPVSVFWGRNPGKEETSLFKLLFFDDEYGGSLQRLITFFVHGRNVFCNIGKPIPLLEMIQADQSLETSTKKVRRVLKVHFRGQRETVLGPQIYDRQRVINQIVHSRSVQAIIQREKERGKSPEWKIERKARRYADEVCAKVSPSAVRFFDVLISWLWRKIYNGLEVKGEKELRVLAERFELVYMPCHRSHMDYLLIGYVLYFLGLIPPHTIAGINLNFWPVGPLLRRGGGIFIRRRFHGNELYGAIVESFVQYLIGAGFPLCFYPEGGRSRTGLLLNPKIGILSMVIKSTQLQLKKPILLVPIYVGYDSLMESKTYQRELEGKSKRSESFGQLVRARNILKGSFGKAYIGFGEPLNPMTYIESKERPEIVDGEPSESLLRDISFEMMKRTNEITLVTPISLIATTLLSSPRRALGERDLVQISQLLIDMGQEFPYSSLVEFPKSDLNSEIKNIEHFCKLKRLRQDDGDIIYIEELESRAIQYYKNNVIHLFTVHSLIAISVSLNKKISKYDLTEGVMLLMSVLKPVLFLPWTEDESKKVIEETAKIMVSFKLIQESGRKECTIEVADNLFFECPPVVSKSHAYLKIIAGIIQATCEKKALALCLLSKFGSETYLDLVEFKSTIKKISHRLSILSGLSEGQLFDESSFNGLIAHLISSHDLIRGEEAVVKVSKRLESFGILTSQFLSDDIRQYISQTEEKSMNSKIEQEKKS